MHTSVGTSMLLKRFYAVSQTIHIIYIVLILCKDNRATIMDDPFVKNYIGELLRSLRTQYLIDLIKPYTRLELSFLAKVSRNNLPLLAASDVFCSNSTLNLKKLRNSLFR